MSFFRSFFYARKVLFAELSDCVFQKFKLTRDPEHSRSHNVAREPVIRYKGQQVAIKQEIVEKLERPHEAWSEKSGSPKFA